MGVKYVFPVATVLFSAVAIISALFVVTRKNPVYGAIFLMGFFGSLSGLFLFLEASFLAATQLFVYVGGIIVLFMFVIMLLDFDELKRKDFRAFLSPFQGFVLSLALFGLLCFPIYKSINHFKNNQVLKVKSNQSQAVKTMRLLLDTQATFKAHGLAQNNSSDNRFAHHFSELGEAGLIDIRQSKLREELPPNTPIRLKGYVFNLTPNHNGQGYELYGTPESPETGTKKYYANHEGVLTYTDDGTPPSISSPPVQSFGSTHWMADEMYTKYPFPIELASILLIAALAGAIGLTKKTLQDEKKRGLKQGEEESE